MSTHFMQQVLQDHIDAGHGSQTVWWDEKRIPLDSIGKRVTDLLDLRGRRAVVTGGAGINLGQACVNRLAGLGADVAVVDLSAEQVRQRGFSRHPSAPDAAGVAAAAAEKWGTKVIPIHGDVMDWDGVQTVMSEAAEALGGIDILVNNAADVVVGDFVTFGREEIDRSVRGTLTGPMYCTRAVLDHMLPQGKGRIINIGSEAGSSAMPWLTVYGALKAGLGQFTRFLGKELGPQGIQVLGVNAGSMWGPDRPLTEDRPETLYPRGRTAIQRYELPEEVANMVAFLASDAASAMNGAMIDMGGGMAV
ncbi:3-oxoacyl-[acyl-carrier protein] reductase [Streptomyces sp. SAI-135]|jgi:3-oxoacyl-[acyl-carrier protein] reductase|uniref:SDR family NAD(P)-dependent oxidoreductase n=1 Tax=unclassified Streptomyces TaxID=2593676 RepID=UPI0024747B53|nr:MULTISPECIES: SDR family oxidoreductase [unclassified Streptomyces]MDH6522791.1 3-oxoacyl-[acyl-carrier protein] reductase [Streptomyces sp. SAI-090]MDH6554412.1 3-oxoacyl-[acyl-carrier protein] reductase [Streptomyces sp. SAI-041]MDH6573678.1 3-oxoacyl-[acyl-carrier protein] reductase [Streptomyces sp. SAI-117]MDH6581589.1 3-oxoacyl-[acyl-carrier protein] reductase [Streptomyces sp. SAI-133]MDH6613594.1 3-oxoacyl-[acyl-carrier protein] reductase [Streptomyces sp. SAI-135]